MFGAEWKKIIRNRGFLILTTVLLAANLMLFFYRQQTVHRNWLYSVSYYKEYQQKIAGMDVQEADAFLMEETVKLGDFQTIRQVLDGEIPEEILEFLEMDNPGILEEFRNSEYADSPKKLEGRMTAAGELQRQMAYIRSYPEYIASIRDNFEDMKKNSFYDGRPYQERLGEKMVADFAGLEKLPLEPGPEYGILSVLENTSADAFLLILVIYVCTVSIVLEKNRNLFGLLKSTRYGRLKLAVVKFSAIAVTTVFLCVLFYGSLWVSSSFLYGLEALERPVQSLELMKGNCRLLTVGGFLFDSYLRTTVGMVVLAWCASCVLLVMKGALSGIGSLLAASACFLFLHQMVSPLAGYSWLHFINPVQWFLRTEEYGSYQTVPFFGIPVRTMRLNQLLMCGLLVLFLAAGIYVICACSLKAANRDRRMLQKVFERIGDAMPCSGNLFFRESWKQFIKNKVLLLLLFSLLGIALSVERTPVNCEKKEQQYRDYIEAFQGPVSEETMDLISKERERIYELQQKLAVMEEQMQKGEITVEKYLSVSAVVESQTEKLEPLERVAAQAEELLQYERETGIRLFLTDELVGEFLFGQRGYDQRKGILVMAFLVFLLSGIFPGEQKNGMINLIRTSKQGRAPLFLSKYILGICLCIPLGAGAVAVKLFSADLLYGFSKWNIPAQSFINARGMESPFSLMELCVLSGLLEVFALCCISVIYISLSLWMKNQFYATLAGGAFFVLPLVLGGTGVSFPWEYTGNRVFFMISSVAGQGMWRQAAYMLCLLLTMTGTVALAWRKYCNRNWRGIK